MPGQMYLEEPFSRPSLASISFPALHTLTTPSELIAPGPSYIFNPSAPQSGTESLLPFACLYLTPLCTQFLILGSFGDGEMKAQRETS